VNGRRRERRVPSDPLPERSRSVRAVSCEKARGRGPSSSFLNKLSSRRVVSVPVRAPPAAAMSFPAQSLRFHVRAWPRQYRFLRGAIVSGCARGRASPGGSSPQSCRMAAALAIVSLRPTLAALGVVGRGEGSKSHKPFGQSFEVVVVGLELSERRELSQLDRQLRHLISAQHRNASAPAE